MQLKVFLKLKKPQNPLFWAKKNQKNQKKNQKPKTTQKNPLGWVFLKKPGFFPTLGEGEVVVRISSLHLLMGFH